MTCPAVLLGEFNGKSQVLPYLERHGWGRMWASYGPAWAYEDEPWGFDNGAWSAFVGGKPFPREKFKRRLATAVQRASHPPCVAVLPDVVGNGLATLALSEEYLHSGDLPDWPWFLAVQDGVCPERVRRMLPRVAGLFLGGTDEFKRTLPLWSRMAKIHEKKMHFARCNREAWVRMALEFDVDSIDSARPVRALTGGEAGKFRLFEQLVTGRCPQRKLWNDGDDHTEPTTDSHSRTLPA